MTREELKQLLRMAMECYPYAKSKVEDPKALLDLWEITFAEWNATDVFKAFRYHVNHSKFFPTPADIKDAIPKGAVIYDDVPTTPRLEDNSTPYLTMDINFLDNIIDIEPDEQCLHCPKRYSCFP